MSEFGSCRSCGKQIRWCKAAKTRKPMPLERDPEDGNVLLDGFGFAHVFRDHARAEEVLRDSDRYGSEFFVSHHARCPKGPAWKGKRRTDADAPDPEPAQGSLL